MSFAALAQWQQNGNGSWSYANEDGSILTNDFTPDGYYVDGSGCWRESVNVLGAEIPARNSFLASSDQSLMDFQEMLQEIHKTLERDMGGRRGFAASDSCIRYFHMDKEKRSDRFSFAREPGSGGYVLELRCPLVREKGSPAVASWYDYQVLRALFLKVSRSGDMLADAIYESWEGGNAYGLGLGKQVQVGDAFVSYEAVNGAGIYRIVPAF